MAVAFLLLAAAILAIWLPWSPERYRVPAPWVVLVGAAVVAATLSGLIEAAGLLAIAALWALCAGAVQLPQRGARYAAALGALALALAFTVHAVPGIHPWVVADQIRLSADSVPMTLRLNFDKGVAGLLLLALWCRHRPAGYVPRALLLGLGVGLATAVPVVGGVWASGFIGFAPKLPAIAPAWMFANAFLTCVMEEALFRGLLQERLALALGPRPSARWLPIALASVLFGLAHAGGGPALVLAAGLAGVGYGLAYRHGGIEAAIVAHFTLNAVHFFGFTYPYAAR